MGYQQCGGERSARLSSGTDRGSLMTDTRQTCDALCEKKEADTAMAFPGHNRPQGKASLLAQFLQAQQGGLAVVFALLLVPLAVAAGIAVDYGRLMAAKARAQAALDSTVLAAATKGTGDTLRFREFFLNNAPRRDLAVGDLTLEVVPAADQRLTFVANGEFSIQSSLMRLAGFDALGFHIHSEAITAGKIISVQVTPVSAQGIFSKDIFFWTKDANGEILSQQTILTYRFDGSVGTTNPGIGEWSVDFPVPQYATFGVGMTVYTDWGWHGDLINPDTKYSDVNPESFIQQTGVCSDANGANYNMEDGGNTDFHDFVYTMKCGTGAAPGEVVHLTK